jgi:hypothetical protein
MRVYDVQGRPSSHEGWVEDAKRGLLGGIGLNGGGILPKRGLEVFGFVTSSAWSALDPSPTHAHAKLQARAFMPNALMLPIWAQHSA